MLAWVPLLSLSARMASREWFPSTTFSTSISSVKWNRTVLAPVRERQKGWWAPPETPPTPLSGCPTSQVRQSWWRNFQNHRLRNQWHPRLDQPPQEPSHPVVSEAPGGWPKESVKLRVWVPSVEPEENQKAFVMMDLYTKVLGHGSRHGSGGPGVCSSYYNTKASTSGDITHQLIFLWRPGSKDEKWLIWWM